MMSWVFLTGLSRLALWVTLVRSLPLISWKKMANIYFAKVTSSEESTVLSLTPRQIALWKSQQGDRHTSAWLRAVPISGLGQTMNGKTYCPFICYSLGLCSLFRHRVLLARPCSQVLNGYIFGDHVVSCAGMVGIKYRHNVVRDTLVVFCSRSMMEQWSWCVFWFDQVFSFDTIWLLDFVLGSVVSVTGATKAGQVLNMLYKYWLWFSSLIFFFFGEIRERGWFITWNGFRRSLGLWTLGHE